MSQHTYQLRIVLSGAASSYPRQCTSTPCTISSRWSWDGRTQFMKDKRRYSIPNPWGNDFRMPAPRPR